MECVIAFIIVVVVLGILLALGAAQHVQFGQSYAYAQLAKKYHGTYSRGGLVRKARVRFRYGSAIFTLSAQIVDAACRTDVTQIEVDWPDEQFWCDVFTAGFPVTTSTPNAGPDVARRLGDAFQVHTNDEARASRFFSEGVRWELTKLQALRGDGEVHLSVGHGRLRVRKLTRLNRFEYLDELTLLALEALRSGDVDAD